LIFKIEGNNDLMEPISQFIEYMWHWHDLKLTMYFAYVGIYEWLDEVCAHKRCLLMWLCISH
jgi:hypothetical protein